jgi:hypothetical protein
VNKSGLPIRKLLVLIMFLVGTSVHAQTTKPEERATEEKTKTPSERSENSAQTAEVKKEEPTIFIHLVNGGRMQVDDVRETADGIWYKKGNVETLLDPKRVARIERPSTVETKPAPERLTRSTSWRISDAAKIEKFFMAKFGRALPMSAFGQSDIHNRWGLDHRQGIDVGLHPDSREGQALQEFLKQERIPYMAFRGAIPGVATGPHIHIGNPSPRYLPR